MAGQGRAILSSSVQQLGGRMAGQQRRSIRASNPTEASAVKEVINAAFQADAFFKRPEYHDRFTLEDVDRMMERQDGVFLVCVEQEEGNDGDPVVVGSLRLEWELRGGAADSEKEEEEEEEELVGHIGAVSVPPRYASRGIGKGLVKAAEEFLVAEVQRQGRPKAPVVMELGVINLRKELFPWYEAMGYSTGKPLPHSEELERIILPGVEVFCIGMSKRLR